MGLNFVEPHQESHLRALVYAHPGAGKTHLCATARKVLLVDFEAGAPATVRSAIRNHPEFDTKIFSATTMSDIRDVYSYLSDNPDEFETVVLDPVTEMQKIMMTEIVNEFPNKRPYGDLPTIQDHQKSGSDLAKLIRSFRSLPLNLVITAHVKPRSNDDEVLMPEISGQKSINYLLGAVDVVGYLYVEGGEDGNPRRRIRFASTTTTLAKNRGGFLPAMMENPTLQDIIDQFKAGAGITEEKEATTTTPSAKETKKSSRAVKKEL